MYSSMDIIGYVQEYGSQTFEQRPFCEVDALIISQFSYMKWDRIVPNITLGYRTPIIALLLMIIIIGYYGEVLSVWEVIVGVLIGVCGIIGIIESKILNY